MQLKERIAELLELTSGKKELESLRLLSEKFPGRAAFSTSFGMEDQVITHLIAKEKIPIRIFSLDTGRHFEETYYVQNMTNARYGIRIETYFPNQKAVETLMNVKGPYSFYESVENRLECCGIRKVESLSRALQNTDLWITGIRASQSTGRTGLPALEWDESHGLIKFHPLLQWSLEEVRKFIKENDVPYNELHDRGFPSIGCAPCTRAVKPGEDIRAGRWWWENETGKECGLHVHQ